MKEFMIKGSEVILSATNCLKVKDFFKEKKEGGMFYYIDPSFFYFFESEIRNSKAKELRKHLLMKDMRIRDIIKAADNYCLLELVDLAHIKQICEKGFLSENVSNYFFIYNKNVDICRISIDKWEEGWHISVTKSKDEYYTPSALRDTFFHPVCFLGNRKPFYPINYKPD